MRVFITGSGGFIGQACIQDLLKHGHQVLGLVRSDSSAEIVTKAGAETIRGDLEDLDVLKKGAAACDGVIHLGFVHDFNDFPRACRIDREAIQAMGDAIAGTNKPLVIASGTLALPKGKLGYENDEVERDHPPFTDRAFSADLVYKMSKENQIRGSVIRLTPTVHGAGDKGFVHMFIESARKNGNVIYVDDGSARWPAVHRFDAAVLFRLALEKGTPGSTYHAVAEQGIPIKDIMGVIGKSLNVPVEGKSQNEAMQALGFFGMVISMDGPVSSEKTQKELGWKPTQIGLLADIEANYF